MTALAPTQQPSPAFVSADDARELAEQLPRATVLRILAPGTPAYDVPLTVGKATLGASPRCTLSLSRPGVQPLHGVLLTDDDTTWITSWSAGLRLNGREFRKAQLRSGDVLQVADLTIGALDAEQAASDGLNISAPAWGPTFRGRRFDSSAMPHANGAAPTQRIDDLGVKLVDVDGRQAALAAGREIARGRCRRLAAELRTARTETSHLAHQVADLERRLGESWQEQHRQQELCELLQQQASETSTQLEAALAAAENQDVSQAQQEADRARIDELQAEAARLGDELVAAQQQCDEQSETNRSLAQQLSDLESIAARRDELESALAAAEQQRAELEQLANEREGALETSRGEIEQLRDDRDRLEATLQEQREQSERLTHQLAENDDAGEALAAAEHRYAELEQLANERESALQALRNEIEQVSEERNRLEATLHEQREHAEHLTRQLAENSDAGEALAAAEQRREDLEQLANEHEAALDGVRSEVEQLRADRDRLETVVEEQRENTEHLAQQLAETNNAAEALAQAEARGESLQTEVASLEKHIEELSANNEEDGRELSELREAVETWKFEKSGLQAEIEGQNGRIAELTGQLVEASQQEQDELQALRSERDALAQELSTAQSDADAYRELLEGQENEIAALRENIAEAESDGASDEQLAESTARLDALADELAASRTQCIEAEQRNEELRQQFEATQADLEAARTALLAVEAQLMGGPALAEPDAPTSAEELEAPEQVEDDPPAQEAADEVNQDFMVDALAEQDASEQHEEQLWLPEEAADEPAEQVVEIVADEAESAGPIEEVETPSAVDDTAVDETAEDAEALERLRDLDMWTDDESAEETDAEDEHPVGDDPPRGHSAADEDAAETKPFEAASFIDQYKHLLPDDDEPVEPVTAPTPPANPLGEAIDASANGGDDEADAAAMEAYMSQMLQRVRGDADPTAPAPTAQAKRPTILAPTGALTEPFEPTDPVDPIGLDELRQSSHKPVFASDLDALRDLANKSARKAISTSRKRRHFEVAISKLLCTVIGLVTSAFMISAAKSYISTTFLGGCVVAIAGLYFGVQLMACLLRAVRDGSWDAEHVEPQAGGEDALPIDGAANDGPAGGDIGTDAPITDSPAAGGPLAE